MIKVICVGKIKEDYLNQLINDYKIRISKYHKIEIIELKDNNIEDESNEIIKTINNKDYNVLLDIKAEQLDSIEFAKQINDIFASSYGNISFIIGGSLGLSDDVLKCANYHLCFSKMTFPHQLMQVILLEQIYRAFKINNNEIYHK